MSNAYKESGVDIIAGDSASKRAATAAKKTFPMRKGKIGEPVDLPNGFAGVMDFGDYYLVQCCDTVGTKIDLAEKSGIFSELGKDLLAMVSDDAVCLGAEVVSITNTFETQKIEEENIGKMMDGLSEICQEQKIIIAGGEIAEVGEKINGTSWGADALGIVEKEKIITGENIVPGDVIISLQECGFRCNGISLVRKILREHFPSNLELLKKCLKGSTVYHNAILHVHGRYGEEQKAQIKGIAHITGGGIPGNLSRILGKKKLGASITDLFEPTEEMKMFAKIAHIEKKELYEVWNMGNGMMIVCSEAESEKIISLLAEVQQKARVCGKVTDNGEIEIL